jgi:ketose-bisphosphate aldolase
MLVTPASYFDDARREGWALGSFTVFNMDSARGVFEALDANPVPAMVAITRRMTPYMDFDGLAAYLRARCEASPAPVAIHLDHSTDLDLVARALDAGFTSVQYDGAGLPIDQKIEQTRIAVEMAHRYGAVAEAELEHIGRTGVEDGGGLTQPDHAIRFVEETGIDVLAVSVGTTHGLSRGQAHIDHVLLAELRERVSCHLALHGGTGATPDDLVNAIGGGIVKVSYFHGAAELALRRLRSEIETTPHGMLATLLDTVRPAFRDRTLEMIEHFGSPGHAPSAAAQHVGPAASEVPAGP